MKSSVFTAMTTPNKLTPAGSSDIRPSARGRERDEGLEHEKDRVQPDHSVGGVPREGEEMVVIQLADDDETDYPAQKLRGKIDKLTAKLTDAGVVVENRDAQFEHEQRHHNRKHRVAEILDPVQPQLASSKMPQQMHDLKTISETRRYQHK
jgi:hypothetical protein